VAHSWDPDVFVFVVGGSCEGKQQLISAEEGKGNGESGAKM